MSEPVLKVPAGSALRSDASLYRLKLAVTKALRAQMDSTSKWRDIAQATGTDQLIKSVHTDETFLDVIVDRMEWQDDEYDAAVRDFVGSLLGLKTNFIPFNGSVVTPTQLPVLEEMLNLPQWLAEHEPLLHGELYAPEQDHLASTFPVDLDGVLAVMDAASANLDRLQKVWERASRMLPTAPARGSDPEYDDLMRAWGTLISGLPPIEGWTITQTPPSMDEMRILYSADAEEDQPAYSVFEHIAQGPQKDLDEYRFRLAKARRVVIRDRLQDLVGIVDTLLPQILDGAPDDSTPVNDSRIEEITRSITEIERLMGDTAARVGRWGHLHRHIRFSEGHDWHDIHELDWPSVKVDIEAACFSEVDPLPIPPGVDLAHLAASKPKGPASTALNWDLLDDTGFERLLYELLLGLPGYQNVQLLMKTRAADRGRDLSAEYAYDDGAGGTRTDRVIVQDKHWRSKSVPPEEIHSGLTRIRLWEPPPIDVYIVATSGHFSPDAVAWIEKHNHDGGRPRIDMWPEARLSTLLSQKPHLVVQFGLRSASAISD
ncbi:restriction endonuclease [Granulicoccus phenolivorans]|uniref:restriction endonuclease n=1 Tax=Granulicoccus phenolivorans TaxID=266854 RepID=UPI001B7F81E4|nr:restriction endonuclease [Granulicoccus phenolivorans]